MSVLSGGDVPSLFPDNLLNGMSSEPSERCWWVLRTKPRQEKAVARDLLGFHVPYYLPLVKRTAYYGKRRFSHYAPVFSGYLFLFGSDDERVQGLTTHRIAQVLPVDDGQRLRHDLNQLTQMISAGAPLTVESRLTPGRRVRVQHGSLAGLEGAIISRRGETRLLVRVDFLQQGASVAMDDFLVEPID